MAKSNSSPKIVSQLIRLALGLLFAYAGAVKLQDVTNFTEHVGDFGIVADSLVPTTAWAIIFVEIVAGVGLLCRWRFSLAATATLLGGYLLVLAYGIAIGLDIECGCLGSGYRVAMSIQMMLDVGLLALVFFLALFDSGVKDDVDVKEACLGGRLACECDDDLRARLRDESVSAGSTD